jgi:hypothetical protein
MADDSARLLEIVAMNTARAGHQGFKRVDPRFDPDRVREEGFFAEGSNTSRSTEYHAGDGFRGGQLQALSDLHQEEAAVNGGQYFDWPQPASTSEGLLQESSSNLGAWPAMAAGLSSGAQAQTNTNLLAQAQTNTNLLLANLSVLQQKAQQLEAVVQEGHHDQPASGVISSILYELIVTAASVLFSVQNRGIANPESAEVQPVPDTAACVEIQAENRPPPVGVGFGKPPNPNGASNVGFAGGIDLQDEKSPVDIKAEGEEEEASPDDRFYEIIEINEDDILAEHTHFCEICGKGFRRDANVRMHMRAHGDEYKTNQALMSRPPDQANKLPAASSSSPTARRYSCPFERCRRNKNHRNFLPLKSITSLRNHYKRSHCPKMYTCHKCNKQFSVVGDLKTHGKHCGYNPWRCSCGTTFTRKDKLFGHVALFQGHKPLLPDHELARPPAPKRHKATSSGRATTAQSAGDDDDGNLTELLAGDLAGLADKKFQGYGAGDDDDLFFGPKVIQMGHRQNEVAIENRFRESDFWADFSGEFSDACR